VDRSRRVALDNAVPEQSKDVRCAAKAIHVLIATAMMSVLLIPHSKKTWRVILATGQLCPDQ